MKELDKKQKEMELKLKIVSSLKEKYHDLDLYVNRWKREYYISSLVDSEVDQVEFGHSCGCCNDSPLYAYPYKEINGQKVYAKGIPFFIGERNPYGYGEIEYENWEQALEKYPKILSKVKTYFLNNKPKNEDFE